MKIFEVAQQIRTKVNSLKYSDTPETQKVSSLIEVGWQNALPKPPENTSDITISELRYLEKLTRVLSPAEKELVKVVDIESLDLFRNVARKNNIKLNEDGFVKLWNICRPIVFNLKAKFNRPRPQQLAPYFGINVNVITTKTHQTPAYPSGHTLYAALAAHLFSAKYPELSGEFFSLVGTVGEARCLQGVHYPSDNEASMTISSVLWEDLKYKLFPDLFI
jgi:hypothetical protein